MTRRQFRAGWVLQIITWLCFTAIPIVNASSVQTADGWLRLCTGLGVTWVQIDTLETAENAPVETKSSSQHCPCVNQALSLPGVWSFAALPGVASTTQQDLANAPRASSIQAYLGRAPPLPLISRPGTATVVI